MNWFHHSGASHPGPADSRRTDDEGGTSLGFEVQAPVLPPVIQWLIWTAIPALGFLPGLVSLSSGRGGQSDGNPGTRSSRL